MTTDLHDLIDRLLYSGEGNALDFKLQQYKFESSTDEDKSELLKDILAFANSWRETTAHIVIGVRDGTKEVEGLDKDIDDAKLQQFVNGKTNKPLHFSYHSFDFRGKRLGLYVIPLQDRPFYLKKAFGKLKADTVYVRRGSSTDEAKPDEIAKMGSQLSTVTAKPNLKVNLISLDEQATRYNHLTIDYTDYLIDEDSPLPDYLPTQPSFGPRAWVEPFSNKDYYREMAKYLREQHSHFGFRIEIENLGNTFADDIRVRLSVPSSPDFKLMESIDFINKPKTSKLGVDFSVYRVSSPLGRSNFSLRTTKGYEVADVLMGKIQAGEAKHSPAIYLMCPPETLDRLSIKVLSDQLGAPIDIEIPVTVTRNELFITAEYIGSPTFNSDAED